jgi:hypothetical protein
MCNCLTFTTHCTLNARIVLLQQSDYTHVRRSYNLTHYVVKCANKNLCHRLTACLYINSFITITVTFFAPAKEEEDDYDTDADVTESSGKAGATQKGVTRRSFSRSPTKRSKSPVTKRSSVNLALSQPLVTLADINHFVLLV